MSTAVHTRDLKNWLPNLEHCGDCPRCNERTQVIPGAGNFKNPAIFFITGAVRNYEDKSKYGSKFSKYGQQLLRDTLKPLGLNRWDHTYVTSIVKCWADHKPSLFEWSDCSFYVEDELRVIAPKLIVLLGQEAVDFWWEQTTVMRLSQARGICYDQGFQKIFATELPDDVFINSKPDPEKLALWNRDWDLIAKHIKKPE